MKKKLPLFIFLSTYLSAFASSAFADIPLGDIQGTGQFQTGNPGAKLGLFISTVLNSITVFAGLAFILYFIIGGLKWITSSGDKGRAEEAKTDLTQAAIGLIVVAVSYFIAGIIGGVVGIDLLNPCDLLDPKGTGICK